MDVSMTDVMRRWICVGACLLWQRSPRGRGYEARHKLSTACIVAAVIGSLTSCGCNTREQSQQSAATIGNVTGVAFLDSGDTLVTADQLGSVRVWHVDASSKAVAFEKSVLN